MKEFWNYYRAVNIGTTRTAKRGYFGVEVFVMIISGLIYALAIGIMHGFASGAESEQFPAMWFIYDMVFMYVVTLSFGLTRGIKPSLLNMIPISYKKRTVFSYLTVLLNMVIFTSCWMLGMLFIMLLGFFFEFIFTGEWLGGELFAEFANISACPQGVIFEVFLVLFTLGAGMAVANVKNKKTRYALMFAVPSAMCVFASILVNVSKTVSGYVFFGNLLTNFENLPVSWLWLTLFALITVAVFAVSVILGLKQEKPKDF